jgi:hypothetical protein
VSPAEPVAPQAGVSPETPAELLARLRSEGLGEDGYATTMYDDELAKFVMRRLALTDEQQKEAEAFGREYSGRRSRYLLEELAATLPAEARPALLDERNLLVADVHAPEVNAHALRAANGGWLILFNAGLMTFVYKLARALGTHFTFEEDEETDEAPPLERTAELIAQVFDWYLATGIPHGPDFPIRPDQMHMASLLTTQAELFVLGHELGHHVLNHTEQGTRSMLVNGLVVDALDVSKQHELEADAVGLKLTLETTNGENRPEPHVAYAGIELFLQVVGMLEAYAAAPESDTHPSAAQRLASVRALLAQATSHHEAVSSLARAVEQMLDAIRPHVLSPERRERALADEEACTRRVAELVEQFAYRDGPRHVPFREAFHEQLEAVAAEPQLRALGRALRAAAVDVEDAGTAKTRGRAHARLGLVLGFLGTNPVYRMAVVERAMEEGETLLLAQIAEQMRREPLNPRASLRRFPGA